MNTLADWKWFSEKTVFSFLLILDSFTLELIQLIHSTLLEEGKEKKNIHNFKDKIKNIKIIGIFSLGFLINVWGMENN